MLELKHITKIYNSGEEENRVLNDVSIRFGEHEFVSILGASGSGKTTLLNIIGGLDSYDEGDMIVDGTSTKSFKDKDWDSYRNGTIGFIFQNYQLISHLSVLENVKIALSISGLSNKESCSSERCWTGAAYLQETQSIIWWSDAASGYCSGLGNQS